MSIQKSRAQAILFQFVFLSKQPREPNVHNNLRNFNFSETTLCKVVSYPHSEIHNAKVEIVNSRPLRIFSSTALTKSSVITDGRLERGSSLTFSRPPLKASSPTLRTFAATPSHLGHTRRLSVYEFPRLLKRSLLSKPNH
ncbi:hypothetical protein TNCV_4356361 [Trichonephila clavipes]|nr:hypothetical protein TNCV_4356361 [Trichonephila clavipes]